MKRWAFTLQMKVFGLYSNIIKENQSNILITERSQFASFNIFGEILKNKNILNNEEYNITEMFYKSNGQEPDIFIYIQTSPYICFERIKTRSHEYEKNIDINYLSSLHDEYEKHFTKSNNIFVINGNVKQSIIREKVTNIVKHISNHLSEGKMSSYKANGSFG